MPEFFEIVSLAILSSRKQRGQLDRREEGKKDVDGFYSFFSLTTTQDGRRELKVVHRVR